MRIRLLTVPAVRTVFRRVQCGSSRRKRRVPRPGVVPAAVARSRRGWRRRAAVGSGDPATRCSFSRPTTAAALLDAVGGGVAGHDDQPRPNAAALIGVSRGVLPGLEIDVQQNLLGVLRALPACGGADRSAGVKFRRTGRLEPPGALRHLAPPEYRSRGWGLIGGKNEPAYRVNGFRGPEFPSLFNTEARRIRMSSANHVQIFSVSHFARGVLGANLLQHLFRRLAHRQQVVEHELARPDLCGYPAHVRRGGVGRGVVPPPVRRARLPALFANRLRAPGCRSLWRRR